MKTFFAFVKQHVFPAVVAMTLSLLLGLSEWMQNVENMTLDLRTKSRVLWQPAMADPQQLVVSIDEESLGAYKAWPWPRRVHGLFLALVGQTMPSVISWDILFTEPSEDDSRLILGLKATEANVIFGAMSGENAIAGEKEADGLLPDDPAVKEARLMPLENVTGDRKNLLMKPRILLPAGEIARLAKSALVDTPPGSDGVRRRVPLMIGIGENVYATMSLQTLMEHWKVLPNEISVRIGESITINNAYVKRTIPIDDTGAILVNYRYATEGFHTVGYSYLASSLNKKFVKKEEVSVPETTGRILMVGQVAAGLTDMGPSPFSALTPMVLVHSNVIDNVLREDYAHEVKWWPIWLGAVVLGAGGAEVFPSTEARGACVVRAGRPDHLCGRGDVAVVCEQSLAAPRVAVAGILLTPSFYDRSAVDRRAAREGTHQGHVRHVCVAGVGESDGRVGRIATTGGTRG